MSHFETLVLVFCLNGAWVALMLATQMLGNLPEPRSLIPGTRQEFLWMQNFWFCWSDLTAVGATNTVFAYLVLNGHIKIVHWCVFCAMAAFLAFLFNRMCLSVQHKPDWAYPELGKISLPGALHVPYFGFSLAAGLFDFWFAITGKLHGFPLYAGIAGGAFYLSFMALDIRAGHFARYKNENACHGRQSA